MERSLVVYRQRGNYDCGLAAMATALQRDYGALWPQDFCDRIEANGGCYGELVDEYWKILGFVEGVDFWKSAVLTKFSHPAFIHRFLEHFGGARVMLQVPSLNDQGKAHMILYWRGKLYDPSNKKRYEKIEDLTELQWVHVFDEKRVP